MENSNPNSTGRIDSVDRDSNDNLNNPNNPNIPNIPNNPNNPKTHLQNDPQDFLLDYPFDLYQRSRDIREIVDIIAEEIKKDSGRDKLKILDVGGFRIDAENRGDLLMREFLPQHDIVALDMIPSDIEGYVQGDGTRLPFKDNCFDIVVTSDVYEHVPPEKRELFLDNLLRVSRGFVVLGAPFYSERNEMAEKMAFEYIRKVLHSRHHQLQEHIDNRLPDPILFNRRLKDRNIFYTTFDSGDLNSWLTMMFLRHYLMSIPETEKLQSMLDRYYNISFYESDHGTDGYGYRKVFVMAGTDAHYSKTVIEKIHRHFKHYIDNKQNRPMDNPDMSHFRMLLDLEVLQTRAQLEEKDGIIRHQAAQLQAFQQMRSTRVYRVMQGINRFTLSPVLLLARMTLGKLQQMGQVITGKRRHPYLSINESAYRRWLKKHDPFYVNPHHLETIRNLQEVCRQLAHRPRISIVVPAYNTPAEFLEKAVDSVLNQIYDNWELCIVNDGSPEKHVRVILDSYAKKDCAKKDRRIKIKHLKRNLGIAGATNEALAMASIDSEFIAFMDSDDLLHPAALLEVVKFINEKPDADVIYSDEDKITVDEKRRRPEFKPDWSPDLFLTYNYINHLTVCRKKLVDNVGGFRAKYDWSQDYDLYLRITEQTSNIYHIPKILYHWREIPGSSASKVDIRPQAQAMCMDCLNETLQRRGIRGFVKTGLRPGTFKIKRI
jgi:hypothetical protein